MKRLNNINTFSKGWRYLLALLVLAPAWATAQEAASDDEVVGEAEGFTVTGSRIKRLDMETVSPVLSLDSDRLEDIGFTTVGDALRSLSFNNGQSINTDNAGTAFGQGSSSVNLRALGNNNTLVLVNGRRVAPYGAPGFNGFQSVFDLNSIPTAAIDSVEVLKDGASAIYGSDAVAGVVNVRLREDYEGMGVSLEVGDYFNTGGLMKKVSMNFGSISAKTSIFVSATYEEQNAVFNRDLDFSDNADQTDRANKADPTWTVINVESTGLSYEDYLAALGLNLNPNDGGWFDNRSSRGFPGRIQPTDDVLDGDGNVVLSGGSNYTTENPTANATLADLVPGSNLYNYQSRSGLFPEQKNFSFYTRAKHQLEDWLYVLAEVSFTRNEFEIHSAPATIDIENSRGIDASTPMFIPSYNPYNPTGQDIFTGRRRFEDGPNRINNVTSDAPRLLAAIGGDVKGLGDWTWEAGALYSKSSVTNLSFTASDSRLQQALQGLTGTESGDFVWSPSTPMADRTFFNWFDTNPQGMVDFITIRNPNVSEFELYNYDVSASGTIGELKGGPIGLAVGAEYREESFSNVRTLANAEGDILGGSEGTSSFGSRDATSMYAEMNLPVLDNLEIQLAGRYERYSDEGFDAEVRPKVGVIFRPFEWLQVRGSFSESFKAPDLAYLYTSNTTVFSSNQVIDPVTGNEIDQLQIRVQGNEDLEPELTDTYFAGLTFEPGEDLFDGLLDGLIVSIEYFEFNQENLLVQLSDIFSYQAFLQGDADGDATFAGRVARDANNNVLFIRDDYTNVAFADYEGFDFTVSYQWQTENSGDFFVQWAATFVDSYNFDGSEQVGGYLTPEWRHTGSINWNYGDWSVNLFGLFIDERERNLGFGGGYIGDEDVFLTYTVKSQFQLNASASFSGFYDTEITVGVNNILDDEPPVDPFDGLGATAGLNYLAPAFWYVRIEREF